jgi:HEAT repeat protein
MLCARNSVWTKAAILFNSKQTLLRLPATPSTVTQARALQGFSALGSLAEPSVPQLVQILEAEPSPQVRAYVALALGQIGRGARSATPALRRAADDKNEEVRRSAVSALINIQMWDDSGRGVFEPR